MNIEEFTRKYKDFQKRYDDLFPDEKSKADAFDKIAEQFYAGNFGQMSKSDFETLMFSIYIEQILNKNEFDFNAYSDFRLAKELGITQSKISTLKVRKQLQYPRNFDWRKSFAKVSKNASYEGGKIKLYIPDKNLYYEIKNSVEEIGGYVDVTLNSNLLVISPARFLDLLENIANEDERKALRVSLRKKYCEARKNIEFIENESWGKRLCKEGKGIVVELLKEAIIPKGTSGIIGDTMIEIVKAILSVMQSSADENM